MAFPGRIRPLDGGKGEVCERLMRALPDWFGIESVIGAVSAEAEALPMWVAEDAGGIVGCVGVKPHTRHAAEINIIAVLPAHHRRGAGLALLAAAEAWARERGYEFLTLKTLSPSRPDEFYERTRRFHEAMGFRPVEEFKTLWNAENPCLYMVKFLHGGV